MLDRLWQEYGFKFFRYCGVSVVNVVVGQGLLFTFYAVIGLTAWTANVAAVTISAAPAYLLSRRWVWRQSGSHSLRVEIAPFWAFALGGLALSTVSVHLVATQWPDSSAAVQLANIGAFGAVWMFKFLFLEKVTWRPAPEAVEASFDLSR